MKIIKVTLMLFVVFLSACNKEGEGGSGTIEGKVIIQLINENTLDTLATYEAQDEKVYIVYGEESTSGDDTRTTYNGNYAFDYLYKGEYTIYAYSECLLHLEDCPGESEAVIKSVTISSSSESVKMPTITINKYTK
jgi:hypothetical protein